jgi:hypothetical protein
MRKLRGLAKSSDGRVSGLGQEMKAILKTQLKTTYAARVVPQSVALHERYAAQVERLRQVCEVRQTDEHAAVSSGVREFRHD